LSIELTPKETYPQPRGEDPVIVPRAEHPISRKNLAREVLWVLGRLRAHGYKAYLVGGAVRDLYLGKSPKDYDVATDARPSRLKKIFRNCRIIGRRFRIAHVFFPSGMIVEVATFRRNSSKIVRGESGIILRDNEYGTPAEDACRRDLTINGLFYDIDTFAIIDFVGGVEDLKNRTIRMINDPETSFREDPVRMLRALRHASRSRFSVDEETLDAIYANAGEIVQANPSRLLEELFKDLRAGYALPTFQAYLEAGLLGAIVPELEEQLADHDDHPLWDRLEVLDRCVREGFVYGNPVLIAVLFQTVLVHDPAAWRDPSALSGGSHARIARGFKSLSTTLRISRRDMERVSQILTASRKLEKILGRPRLPRSLAQKIYMSDLLQYFRIDLEARGEPTEVVDGWLEQVEPPPADADGDVTDATDADAIEGEGVLPELDASTDEMFALDRPGGGEGQMHGGGGENGAGEGDRPRRRRKRRRRGRRPPPS